MTFDPRTVIAEPGFAPADWQVDSASPVGSQGWSKAPIESSPDLARILALPRRPQLDDESPRAAAFQALMRKRLGKERDDPCRCADIDPARAKVGSPCIVDLKPKQAWALYELGVHRGLLGSLAVGFGKTILGLLAPLVVDQCRTAVLLVPPKLVEQLIHEYTLLEQHWHVPSLFVHATGDHPSKLVKGAPALHVLPYSRLCRPESTRWFAERKPDAVFADEVHKLRDPKTATTARVLRHFHENPATVFAGWTGSMTDASINDYAHLAALALRERSPLPLDPNVVADWSGALDARDWLTPPGALLQLCNPGEHVRDGFSRRLLETGGIVATSEASVDVELVIQRAPSPVVPQKILDAIADVKERAVRPDGEELTDQLAVARVCRELACGFYHRWIYPRGEPRELIDEWFEARQEWHRELRSKLTVRAEHLDSEKLCTKAAIAYWRRDSGLATDERVPHWPAITWPRWDRVRHLVKPRTDAVLIDDFLAEACAEWAHRHRGIVWYDSAPFGRRIAQLAQLPQHTGGPGAAARLRAERGETSIIASRKAHGTGTNGLQYLFDRALVAQPMPSAAAWEQLLGRLHRHGQVAEAVTAEFFVHTDDLRGAVDEALRRAGYVADTWRGDQKLITGLAQAQKTR